MSFEVIIGDALERAIERQVGPIMERALNELRAVMIEEFKAPKSGREYRRPGGERYRASAPGEPPADRSGQLRASIGEPQISISAGALVGQLLIAAPYAGYLERGTPRISPRPFVGPAIQEILRKRA